MTQRKLFGSVYTTHFVRPCDNLVYFIHSLFFISQLQLWAKVIAHAKRRVFRNCRLVLTHLHALHFRVTHLLCSREQMSFFFGLCTNTQPFSALLIHQKYNLNKKKKKAVRNQWMALDWHILLLIVRQISHLLISSSFHLPSFSLWCRAYA